MTNELEDAFVREITDLEKRSVGLMFVFTASEAFALLATLQLSLCDPRLAEDSPDAESFLRRLAEAIERRLCKTPALKEVARRGWILED